MPVVASRAPGRHGGVASSALLLCGAVALVGETGSEQPADRPAVEVGALALQYRPFVPVEPEPAQRVLHTGDRGVGRPRPICVLDAQDERTAFVARVEPVEQGRPRVPHMDLATGGRRIANADAGHQPTSSSRCRAMTTLCTWLVPS